MLVNVFNYAAKMVSKDLEAETVIVFDEAHNIDSICIEALSVTINDRGLQQATRSLGRLSSEVSKLKASDNERLQQEYQNLVNGLIDQGLLDAPASEVGLGSVRITVDKDKRFIQVMDSFAQKHFFLCFSLLPECVGTRCSRGSCSR